MELRLDDVPVERLHDVFVSTGVERTVDVPDIVLGGAAHHLGAEPARQTAHFLQECYAVHSRHVQIEKHHVGKAAPAHVEGLLAVFRLGNLELHPFQDAARHLANDAGVIDHETGFHWPPPLPLA
jgi:hypothetical protein